MANQYVEAGRRYLEGKLPFSIDGLTWRDPDNPPQDASELRITSRGKREVYLIENLDLEDVLRRADLDQRAELIALDFT